MTICIFCASEKDVNFLQSSEFTGDLGLDSTTLYAMIVLWLE